MKTITNLSAYSKTDSYLYMLLERLQEDCEYYLGNGNRNSKYLWALNESEHINEMKGIYNYLEVKPDWLTMQEIENFEQQFNQLKIMEENELNRVLDFIENWQNENVYNSSFLHEFNAKFRKDIKVFFEKSNFKTITVNEIIK